MENNTTFLSNEIAAALLQLSKVPEELHKGVKILSHLKILPYTGDKVYSQ